MTSDEVERLEALDREATPAPWTWVEGGEEVYAGDRGIYGPDGVAGTAIVQTDSGVYGPENCDAELIIAARHALPRLLMERRRMLEALRRVRDRAEIGQMAAQQGMVFSFDQAVADAIRFSESPLAPACPEGEGRACGAGETPTPESKNDEG